MTWQEDKRYPRKTRMEKVKKDTNSLPESPQRVVAVDPRKEKVCRR